MQAMALAGTSGNIPSAGGLTAPATPTIISGSTANFTIGRQQRVLALGTINAGTNAALGGFNIMQLTASGTLNLEDAIAFPHGLLTGVGAGTVMYLPTTLLMVLSGEPGSYSAWWQLNAVSTGSVSVHSGNLDVFYLSY